MFVNKDTRNTLIAVAAVAAVFVAGYACLMLWSGASTPFYTVESGSMRHSDGSKIGVIDTGDMVLVKDPSKVDIITYVEGYGSGYRMFGDHGDVVIYAHPDGKTIIHRAMLHLEHNGAGEWIVRGLGDYTGSWKHGTDGDIPGTAGQDKVFGKLVFENFGYFERTVTIDLMTFGSGAVSGYVTMGDHNSPMVDGVLVTDDMIVAIAMAEVPWIGCIKLYLTGKNIDQIPSNSKWSLIITMIVLIGSLVTVNFLYERMKRNKG